MRWAPDVNDMGVLCAYDRDQQSNDRYSDRKMLMSSDLACSPQAALPRNSRRSTCCKTQALAQGDKVVIPHTGCSVVYRVIMALLGAFVTAIWPDVRCLTSCCALQLPGDIKLNYFDKENNMQEISIEELTKGKKVLYRSCPNLSGPLSLVILCW